MNPLRRFWTRVVLFGILVLGLGFHDAIAYPTCYTSHVIAVPTGLNPGLDTSDLDKDGDQLLDKAEEELAHCFVPHYLFDSAEEDSDRPRYDYEPVLLYSLYPSGFTAEGELQIQIQYGVLYHGDGGYIYCDVVANWCDDHAGDSGGFIINLVVKSLKSAQISDFQDIDSDSFAQFDDTHIEIYSSAGKHHQYFSPQVCNNPDEGNSCEHTCDFADVCWNDRANGEGVYFKPEDHFVENVGQEEDFTSPENPQRPFTTPKGFVNDLVGFGYFGEYVYDPCDEPFPTGWMVCDEEYQWKNFFNDDEPVTPVHNIMFNASKDTSPIYLNVSENGLACNYASGPPSVGDSDNDEIPDICDPCPKATRRGYPDGDDLLVGINNQQTNFVFADSDGDGRTEGCDLCPGYSDKSLGNGNLDGEVDLIFFGQQGDACDPNAVSSITGVQTPAAYELFEEDASSILISMRNAQVLDPEDEDPEVLEGNLVTRRCFCVDNAGNKVSATECSRDDGAPGSACPRNGVPSSDYTGGIGWLPFRSSRIDASTPDSCQPLEGGELCERSVVVSYPSDSMGNPTDVSLSEEYWHRRPLLRWDIWEETQQRIAEEEADVNSKVPAIPEAARVDRIPLWWEDEPSTFLGVGNSDGIDSLIDLLLCALDKDSCPPICSGYVPCYNKFDLYSCFAEQYCMTDSLPFHVDGDVAFWSRVAPEKLISPDDGDNTTSHIHDSFSSAHKIVTTDRRGYTQTIDLPLLFPDNGWFVNPTEGVIDISVDCIANPQDCYLGDPGERLGGMPMIYLDDIVALSGIWNWDKGYAVRWGDLSEPLRDLSSNTAWTLAGTTPGAFSGEVMPVWNVFDAPTGGLFEIGPEYDCENPPCGTEIAGLTHDLEMDQYVVQQRWDTGIIGRRAALAKLDEFLVLAVQGDAGWSFYLLREGRVVIQVSLPSRWEDELSMASIAGVVVVVGRITPSGEEASGSALALIDATGNGAIEINPNFPIRSGSWIGRTEDRPSLLLGGGVDERGFAHGDVVEVKIPSLEVLTVLPDGEVDPSALGQNALLFGRGNEGQLSLSAVVKSHVSDRVVPMRRLEGGKWQPAGLAAVDSPRTDVTVADRLRFNQLCAESNALWWSPPGRYVWSDSVQRTDPPLICEYDENNRPSGGPALLKPGVDIISPLVRDGVIKNRWVTAYDILGVNLFVATAKGVEQWTLGEGLPRKIEKLGFGRGAQAISVSSDFLALATSTVVEVYRNSNGMWSLLGTTSLCDGVQALYWEGRTLWAVGETHVTSMIPTAEGVPTSGSFVLGTDEAGVVRLRPLEETCGRGIEPIRFSTLAGNRLVIATQDQVFSYDLRRPPYLPIIGIQSLEGGETLRSLRTDGTWIYAKMEGREGDSYLAWRVGPSAAFVDTGGATAGAWIDGVEYGDHFAVRRSGKGIEVKTW